MSEYVITTDNNSDLPEEYLKDHGVGCMYLSYSKMCIRDSLYIQGSLNTSR